jgi:hypothetical protein
MARKTARTAVELIKTFDDQFDPSAKSAQIRQVVTTTYEYSRSPFMQGERDFESNRYCFVAVPADWDDARIQKELLNGNIQRSIGCIPESVMTEGQLGRLESLSGEERETFLDNFKNRHRLVTKEGVEIDHQGFETYGRNVFVLGEAQDRDLRDQDVATLLIHDDEDSIESPFIERQIATA